MPRTVIQQPSPSMQAARNHLSDPNDAAKMSRVVSAIMIKPHTETVRKARFSSGSAGSSLTWVSVRPNPACGTKFSPTPPRSRVSLQLASRRSRRRLPHVATDVVTAMNSIIARLGAYGADMAWKRWK